MMRGGLRRCPEARRTEAPCVFAGQISGRRQGRGQAAWDSDLPEGVCLQRAHESAIKREAKMNWFDWMSPEEKRKSSAFRGGFAGAGADEHTRVRCGARRPSGGHGCVRASLTGNRRRGRPPQDFRSRVIRFAGGAPRNGGRLVGRK